MEKNDFIKQINEIETRYKKKLTKEQVNEMWNNFNRIDVYSFRQAINKHKYIPSIAELKKELNIGGSFENINLNSSYWYINLRNEEPFNIRNGKPLAPFRS